MMVCAVGPTRPSLSSSACHPVLTYLGSRPVAMVAEVVHQLIPHIRIWNEVTGRVFIALPPEDLDATILC